jgi:hypothetical protein
MTSTQGLSSCETARASFLSAVVIASVESMNSTLTSARRIECITRV